MGTKPRDRKPTNRVEQPQKTDSRKSHGAEKPSGGGKEEERYRLLWEMMPICYQSLDEDGNFLEVNRAWLDTLGYCREEVIGKPFSEFLPPDSVDGFRKRFSFFKASGAVSGVEFEMVKKDGSSMTVSFEGRIGCDQRGGFKQTCCVFQDISERKRASQALEESEQRYKRITEAVTDYIFSVRIENGHPVETVHSPACVAVTGYTKEEFATDPYLWIQMVHEQDREAVREQAGQILSGQDPQPLEHRILRKDGRCRWVRNTLAPFYDQQGRLVSYDGLISDITERKSAEERIRESEEQFRLLSEQSVMGIIIVQDETFRYVNQAASSILEYAIDEMLHWKPKEYPKIVHPDDLAFVIEQARKKQAGEREVVVNYDWRAVTKTGKTKWVETYSKTVQFRGKNADLIAMIDISARKGLEAQLQRAQKMEAIGTLAGGIAHDFNNILTPILVQAELAKFVLANDHPVQSNLDEVLHAATRAKDLVKQILAFSRQTEQKRMPLKPASIVKEALKLLRSSVPSTIKLRERVETESDTVLTDPTAIHQLLMNLCVNAVHAMREKGGFLDVSLANAGLGPDDVGCYPALKPGPYVKLTVRDTGHGMDDAVKARIFDPFFTTKGPGEGTGMGLAVVHGIVKSHGGKITVDSEPGKGTTFIVLLPATGSKVSEELKTETRMSTGNERILVVDDESVMVKALKDLLERLGYRVISRTSSVEALEAFRAEPRKFDLVITDQTMPNMTGAELAQEVMRVRADIPVILCTGFSELIDGDRARAMGIREFVMKPIVMREMAETIRRALDE